MPRCLRLCTLLTATVFAAAGAIAAHAQTITGSDIKHDYLDGSYSSSFSVLAYSPSTASPRLGLHWQSGTMGVGVVGGNSSGDLDGQWGGTSESITLTFAQPTQLSSFSLGGLYSGTASRIQEAARITVNADATPYFLLTGGSPDLASWYHGNNWLGNVSFTSGSNALNGDGSAISVFNPFAGLTVSSLMFEAGQARCDAQDCSGPSGYNIISVTPVPEPSTLALMAGGLVAVCFMMRRRPTA